MLGIIARSRRSGEKFHVARFLLKIFHPPWRPQRFDFFLRKLLHRDLAIARETKMLPGKVEHFEPLVRQQNVIRATEIFALTRFEPAR